MMIITSSVCFSISIVVITTIITMALCDKTPTRPPHDPVTVMITRMSPVRTVHQTQQSGASTGSIDRRREVIDEGHTSTRRHRLMREENRWSLRDRLSDLWELVWIICLLQYMILTPRDIIQRCINDKIVILAPRMMLSLRTELHAK